MSEQGYNSPISAKHIVRFAENSHAFMAKKLYVGNLPYSVTQDDLQQIFSQAGQVESAMVITDKFSGRSKGFGFVEMSSDEEAQKAIETLHGSDVQGRQIVVNEARPLQERGPRRPDYQATEEN